MDISKFGWSSLNHYNSNTTKNMNLKCLPYDKVLKDGVFLRENTIHSLAMILCDKCRQTLF